MRVYRIGNRNYARDLFGEGARLHGGRWNHMGIPCLYSSGTRSLCVLELSVNVSLGAGLRNLSMTEIEIPDDILELSVHVLPVNWHILPAPNVSKDYGTDLLNQQSHAVIKIPSAVIPEEFNYLVNPGHPLARKCRVIKVNDFTFDTRIKAT